MRIFSCLLLLSFVLLLSDCKNTNDRAVKSGQDAAPPSLTAQEQPLRTDSFKYALKSEHGSCDVYIDYPTEGPPVIVSTLREFIKATLFEDAAPDLEGDDAQEMVRKYCMERQKNLAKTLEQMGIHHVSESDAPEEAIDIRMVCRGEKFVTYEVYRYSFITHGAHGEYSDYGVTFRISDGHRFGDDLLAKTDEDLYAHIRAGLKSYFEIADDRQLEEICTTDLSLMPMPTFPPYLVADGVRFHYSIYDICPFDWGDPAFTIPYAVIRPYLTESAKELLTTQNSEK